MNKRNKILVGCLTLLLVLSVGYALFSETIEINGTATAKGSFDITTTCTPGYSDEFITLNYAGSSAEGQAGYENDTCTVNGNIVSANVDLKYPSAIRFFTIKFTNKGTIPAVYNVETGMSGIVEWCVKELHATSETCTNSKDNPDPAWGYILGGELSDIIETNGKLITSSDSEYADFYNSDTKELTLNPNDSIFYVMSLSWPWYHEQQFDSGKIDATLDFNFIQKAN